MGFEIVNTLDATAWDEFIIQNPNSNIYHTRQFMECFHDFKNYGSRTYFLVNSGQPIVLISALQTKTLGPHLESLSSRSIVYGGILYSYGISKRHLQKHISDLIQTYDYDMHKKVILSEIRNVEDATPLILEMSKKHYRFIPHLNYLIGLEKGEKHVFQNMSSTLRRKIRHTQKLGIEVHDISDAKELDDFYSLIENTYSRVHVPFFEKDIFYNICKIFSDLGWIRITLAKYNNQFIAGRAALIHNDRILDWFAGSNEKGNSLNANAYLAWDMIKWGIKNGIKQFDFGGAGDPNKEYGPRDFKSRFYGIPTNYGRFIKVYSRLRYSLAYSGYNILRRVLY